MRIGHHVRPSSALVRQSPLVRAIFVSVEVSRRGRRAGVKTSPYRGEVGLFSDQDEAGGSSPPRPTIRP